MTQSMFICCYSNMTYNDDFKYNVFNVGDAEDCFYLLERRYWNTTHHDDGHPRFSLYESKFNDEFKKLKCAYVPHRCFIIMDAVGNPVSTYIVPERKETANESD